jgi:hypothetical protein
MPALESHEYPILLRAELRREIVEAQRSGSDLLKWKLIAAATVASIGVGFWNRPSGSVDTKVIICLVPLICAYVDTVSLDLAVRTMVIASFLRNHCDDEYEHHVQFVRQLRHNPFMAAPIAIHASSLVSSLIVASLGVYGNSAHWATVETAAFLTAGIIGAAVAILQYLVYSSRVRTLGITAPPAAVTTTA